jgi:hypothetical protein
VYWCTASEVDHAEILEEAAAPDHMGEGVVYKRRPELVLLVLYTFRAARNSTYEDERNQGQNPTSLTCSTYGNRTNCSLKYELEETEQDGWDSAHRFRQDVSMKRIGKVSKDRTSFTVGQGVADEKPLDRANDDCEYRRYDSSERVGPGCITRVRDAYSGYDSPT